MYNDITQYTLHKQKAKINIGAPIIILVILNLLFSQYCDKNIELISIALYKVIALNLLRERKTTVIFARRVIIIRGAQRRRRYHCKRKLRYKLKLSLFTKSVTIPSE